MKVPHCLSKKKKKKTSIRKVLKKKQRDFLLVMIKMKLQINGSQIHKIKIKRIHFLIK